MTLPFLLEATREPPLGIGHRIEPRGHIATPLAAPLGYQRQRFFSGRLGLGGWEGRWDQWGVVPFRVEGCNLYFISFNPLSSLIFPHNLIIFQYPLLIKIVISFLFLF